MSVEQQARDMLERMGIVNAQTWSAGELVELANLIAERTAPEVVTHNKIEIMRLIDCFGSGPQHGGVRRDYIEAKINSLVFAWQVMGEQRDNARKEIAKLDAENQSLRAECGLRQIQGYNEGRAKEKNDRSD